MAKLTNDMIVNMTELLVAQMDTSEIKMTQIADALSVSHSALYKHFNNKEDLLVAVAKAWFKRTILSQMTLDIETGMDKEQVLHDKLWAFTNAKKTAFNENPHMFEINTRYVDSNPLVLREVLFDILQMIDELMDYHDAHLERAETILAAFSVFMLPNFKETWNLPNYQARFEQMWQLIEKGI
ncbi:TetR/AcrR family transcriptional regulator [Dellaglioa sp. L3N]